MKLLSNALPASPSHRSDLDVSIVGSPCKYLHTWTEGVWVTPDRLEMMYGVSRNGQDDLCTAISRLFVEKNQLTPGRKCSPLNCVSSGMMRGRPMDEVEWRRRPSYAKRQMRTGIIAFAYIDASLEVR